MAIEHHRIEVNGIRLHYVASGSGPLVLLCHGWPELWYSWRHQIKALAQAGFRVVAPDMRGFGESEAPTEIERYTIQDNVGDMVALIQALGARRAAIIGHDWGAPIAWNTALMRPDLIRGVVGLSVPFLPVQGGGVAFTELLRAAYPPGFYMLWFQEPGRAEADLEEDPRLSLRRFYYSASGSVPEGAVIDPVAPERGRFTQALWEPPGPLPWLSDADLDIYAAAYAKSGFRGGLNWYRNLDRSLRLQAPFLGAGLQMPALFIAGSRDYVTTMPGMAEAIAAFPVLAPRASAPMIIEGAGHWVQQEAPEAVNRALIEFLGTLAD